MVRKDIYRDDNWYANCRGQECVGQQEEQNTPPNFRLMPSLFAIEGKALSVLCFRCLIVGKWGPRAPAPGNPFWHTDTNSRTLVSILFLTILVVVGDYHDSSNIGGVGFVAGGGERWTGGKGMGEGSEKRGRDSLVSVFLLTLCAEARSVTTPSTSQVTANQCV